MNGIYMEVRGSMTQFDPLTQEQATNFTEGTLDKKLPLIAGCLLEEDVLYAINEQK